MEASEPVTFAPSVHFFRDAGLRSLRQRSRRVILASLLFGQAWTHAHNLFSRRILKPRNSRPTRISHEPGVKGVRRAANPRTIQMTPTVIFRVLFISTSNSQFPRRARIVSISSIVRFITAMVLANGSAVVKSTPARFNVSIG